ncbi:MAG TPA: hypothetical protein V6C76_06730 [Drouetiella sp.]
MFLINFVVYLVLGMMLMSLIEHQVHMRLMHKKYSVGKFFPAIDRIFRSHAIEHHGTYRAEFSDHPVPPGEDRGIRLNHVEGLIESLPGAALFLLLSPLASVVFMIVVQIHHLMWNAIHLEMHKPAGRFFSNWAAYKFCVRHHMLHHRHASKNFNVALPLGDYLCNTVATPNYADLVAFYHEGLLPGQKGKPVAARKASARQAVKTAAREPQTVGSARD